MSKADNFPWHPAQKSKLDFLGTQIFPGPEILRKALDFNVHQ